MKTNFGVLFKVVSIIKSCTNYKQLSRYLVYLNNVKVHKNFELIDKKYLNEVIRNKREYFVNILTDEHLKKIDIETSYDSVLMYRKGIEEFMNRRNKENIESYGSKR